MSWMPLGPWCEISLVFSPSLYSWITSCMCVLRRSLRSAGVELCFYRSGCLKISDSDFFLRCSPLFVSWLMRCIFVPELAMKALIFIVLPTPSDCCPEALWRCCLLFESFRSLELGFVSGPGFTVSVLFLTGLFSNLRD